VPFQNRVDPYGRLHAVAARGAWMGNRGVLIDSSRQVVAPWRLTRWITCVLEFRGRSREVFTPGRYTELFFLDEATSLAAGHRPCAECRRPRYEELRRAWTQGASRLPSAVEMDRVLHDERLAPGGGKRTFDARLGALPHGAIVERAGAPHLWRRGALRPWSFEGYGPPVNVSATERVAVLTPRSIVRAIAAGFAPQVHGSADGG
jgi:hypothetical protein